MDEEREFVVGRVDGNRAPDEGEVAWVVMIRSRRRSGRCEFSPDCSSPYAGDAQREASFPCAPRRRT